jgi:predicted dinucleotide-binding enzyme
MEVFAEEFAGARNAGKNGVIFIVHLIRKILYMNIGVLGTGVVGRTIGTALTEKGHNVRLGSRTMHNDNAADWVKKSNNHATHGDFNDAATFGELVFFCLKGEFALDAIAALDPDNLAGKILVDVSNPLDFSQGMPPGILPRFSGTSLGEEIQKALPGTAVVKTLNTVTCSVMVDPKQVSHGDHSIFICGNDSDARNKIKHFLVDNFGWKPDHILDLGPISSARTTEAYVPFWVSIMQSLGTPVFNIKVVR